MNGLDDFVARASVAALRGDADGTLAAAKGALALMADAPSDDCFDAALELAPALLEAGFVARTAALVDGQLAICEGRRCRALLLGLRAWLRDARGDEHGAFDDLERALATADAADVVRREWALLRPLLAKALTRGRLESPAVEAMLMAGRL